MYTPPRNRVLSGTFHSRVIRTAKTDCFMGLLRGLYCAD